MPLFELQSKEPSDYDKEVIIVARNPGEADALWPLLPVLAEQSGLKTKVASLDHATERIGSVVLQSLKEVTVDEKKMLTQIARSSPSAIVSGIASDPSFHQRVKSFFPETPHLFVEDYYGSSGVEIERDIQGNIKVPDFFTSIDELSLNATIKEYGGVVPDLGLRTRILGQPAFDYLRDQEGQSEKAQAVREHLGISKTDKLISIFASTDQVGILTRLAEALYREGTPDRVAFFSHPRDIVEKSTYIDILKQANIDVVDTEGLAILDIISASNLVTVVPASTVSLHALLQGIPVIHTDDQRVTNEIPVRVRASPVVKPEDFWKVADPLLVKHEPKHLPVFRAMQEFYPRPKGTSAAQIVDYISEIVHN